MISIFLLSTYHFHVHPLFHTMVWFIYLYTMQWSPLFVLSGYHCNVHPLLYTMVWFIYLYTMKWSLLFVQVIITVMCTHCCIQWWDSFTCIPCSDHHFLECLSLSCAPIANYNGVIYFPVYHAVNNTLSAAYHCHVHPLWDYNGVIWSIYCIPFRDELPSLFICPPTLKMKPWLEL